MHALSLALTALAIVAPAAAAGKAIVVNQCTFDVHLLSVCSETTDFTPTLIKAGGNYSETYQSLSVGGVSIKISDTESIGGPITQLEYTLSGGFIWYDLSNVNCDGVQCPFQKYGMYLQSGDSCPTRTCSSGEVTCRGAFNAPDDNENVLSCAPDADTTLYLCATSAPNKKRSEQEQEVPVRHRRRISHPHIRHYVSS